MTISGQAKIAGIMGHPVGHSRSPRLHNYWLKHHGIDGAYVPFDVAPENLETAMRALPVLGLRGVNLTIPHKENVMPFLDEIDPVARRLGAVNTVVARPDGSLWGTSTDGAGFVDSLLAEFPGFDFGSAAVLVLGAGGAARAIIGALLDRNTPEIRIHNRTETRIAQIIADLGKGLFAGRLMAANDPAAAMDQVQLVINTTSQGMQGMPPLDIDLHYLPEDALVADIVYAPLETRLLKSARMRGNPTLSGIGMLVYQARAGFHHWFGYQPDVTPDLIKLMTADL